jgi:hypothetical protein
MKQALLIGSILLIPASFMVAGGRDAGGGSIAAANVSGTFQGGASSQRELIDELLQALQKKDVHALRRLRVTETEYRDVILPGNVPPGQPPRNLVATWKDYAWANLNDRSTVHEERLLGDYGGQALSRMEFSFEDGEQEYAGYKAYRQLRLKVRNSDGAERELRTGSIAEVAGKYKFISFNRD